MSTIPSTHKAAAFTGSTEDGKLIEIVETPTVLPVPAGKLLVKVKAAALNPTDWKHIVVKWGEKGDIVGADSAGVVVAVGSNVKGFSVGDNVSSFTHGSYTYEPASGSLQDYLVVEPSLTIRYNKKLTSSDKSEQSPVESFEGAASITLGVATVGMSLQHEMKLPLDKSKNSGKTLLIWGGATATGILAIQVAKRVYGLTVITTASKKHNEFLKKQGADFVFDYHDKDVVEQIRKAAGGDGDELVYALDTVSVVDTFNATYETLSRTKPAHFDNLLGLDEKDLKGKKKRDNVTLTSTLTYRLFGNDQILGGEVVHSSKEIVDDNATFWRVIQKAVNEGIIEHAPLKILKGGYKSAEEGYSLLRNGKVSAEKLIVRPDNV
ncbi:DEKNAAC103144 [Brettanomyces naardenensis]|uniref:DEKNAAC103144 n=1 Tax=Brettanomyces naardenensis TaxID=13370 RepID=A0A448YMP1_BRENA|nr:DEKNAAC103144 [Brettanomyces naardenensis]